MSDMMTDEEYKNMELEDRLKPENVKRFTDIQLKNCLEVIKCARRVKPEKKSKDPAPAAEKKKETIDAAVADLAKHGLEL